MPRILEYYGKECFYFSDNFLRMVFLSEQPVHDTEQVTEQVEKLISVMDKEHSTSELMEVLNLSQREHFRKEYLQKTIDLGLVELTIPDKPTSSKQKYRLTKKGITYKTKN